MNMDNHTEVLAEVRLNRNYIIEILQRVAKLEEKNTTRTTLYGVVGGFLPAVVVLIWWLVGK